MSQAAGRIHAAVQGPIGWLRLDNQEKLNAVSLSMWQDLSAGLAGFANNDIVRVVVVSGTGGKAFCSGGDISEFESRRSGANAVSYGEIGKAALSSLKGFPKPTIASIEGYCLGGGMALALSCDVRIAADTAQLGIPAARRGQSYEYANVKLLVDLVGPSKAKLLLFTARRFDAEQALRMGLVDEVVTGSALVSHVEQLADTIAGNAPLSIAAIKFAVDTVMADPNERDLQACAAQAKACLASEDYAEATRSFMEKRSPIFKGC